MAPGHRFHHTILREYDIRGIVGETLTEDDARAVGAAFATIIARGGGRRICLGYDGRLSSPVLEAAAAEGLASAGIAVVRVGLGPTPMLYFAVHTLGADGGLMVTGSHNPPTHNGFKMMRGKAAFFGRDIAELGSLAAKGDYGVGRGSVEEVAVLDDYVARLRADCAELDSLAIGWDSGNGATGQAVTRLTAALGGRHVLLNAEIDGLFPAHHPDPTVPDNLVQLQDMVAREKLDLGFAFDGDGDRIGVIDGLGRILWGDQLLALLARDVLGRNPGATIIADVKASQVLFDEIARLGGAPLMWHSGHSLIKSKMAEVGAPLAGEMSGHIFFADGYYGFDDALYAAIRLINVLVGSGSSLADLHDQLPVLVNTPELRFPCSEERKFEVVAEVEGRLRAAGADLVDIDGVRVTTPDGWWLLRASNTQAVLVARCEAPNEAALARLKESLVGELAASGIDSPV